MLTGLEANVSCTLRLLAGTTGLSTEGRTGRLIVRTGTQSCVLFLSHGRVHEALYRRTKILQALWFGFNIKSASLGISAGSRNVIRVGVALNDVLETLTLLELVGEL